MELGVQQLNLNDIKEPLPEDGTDPYQLIQVHDYKSVSFFRMDPVVKAATKRPLPSLPRAIRSCSTTSTLSTFPPSWAGCLPP
jgi:hypothetical protein